MRLYTEDGSDFIEVLPPKSLLSPSIAARFEQLCDLYAPMDEDGKRHPEDGLISEEQFRALLDMAVMP